jgi:hypothetical protein
LQKTKVNIKQIDKPRSSQKLEIRVVDIKSEKRRTGRVKFEIRPKSTIREK